MTVLNTTSSTTRPLSLNATFACAEAYSYCDQTNTTCKQSQQTCPASATQTASLMQGSCLADGNGIEAGWSFSTSANESASSLALPEQVFRAGLIQQRVVSGLDVPYFAWKHGGMYAPCLLTAVAFFGAAAGRCPLASQGLVPLTAHGGLL